MKYYLATNNIDVFHFGSCEEECEITTGQPTLNFYTTEDELAQTLGVLTGNVNYYYENKYVSDEQLSPENPPNL